MLKTDLHIHTKEDPCDPVIYTAKEMIKYKAKLGFKVLAVTNHNSIYFNQELKDYAKRHGVLLISGMEALIEGKEVLFLNPDKEKFKFWKPSINKKYFYESLYPSLNILEKFREDGVVIGAPHPYYIKNNCLANKIIEKNKLFDFIEHSHFYTNYLNRNKKAIKVARRFGKTLIANTDAHSYFQLKLKNYTYIDAEPKLDSVLEAIRKGYVKIVSKPLSTLQFSYILYHSLLGMCANNSVYS